MRALFLAGALLATPSSQADILYLRDGSRHYGTLIARTDEVVLLRVEAVAGQSPRVRQFARQEVRFVERTPVPGAPVDSPPPSAPAAPGEIEPRQKQLLFESFELLDDLELPAALRVLQRVVSGAPPQQIEVLERLTRAQRGVPLDELIAHTRLSLALLEEDRGRFALQHVGEYEAAALGRLLSQRQALLLSRQYDSRSLESWSIDPHAYAELSDAAPELARDAALAAAFIGARLRFDPALRAARRERSLALERREALQRLVAHVRGLPGFTSLDSRDAPDDPTLAEQERLRTIADEQAARLSAAATQPASAPAAAPGNAP